MPTQTNISLNSGTTRLKLWVKILLKILPVVFFRVLNTHSFSLVEPVGWALPTVYVSVNIYLINTYV